VGAFLSKKWQVLKSFEGVKVIDKFNGENFNLWKFKIDMVFASMDLGEIEDSLERHPSNNANPKVKEYQKV